MDNCITSLGLMSGTSLDGIDASIINSDGNSHLKVKVNHFYEYKAEFRQKLRDYIKNINSKKNILITLKEDGYYHYPHFNDTSLFLRMMKLTQVPISLHPTLMKFVQNLNNNRFYI